jgi:hypothetical protein
MAKTVSFKRLIVRAVLRQVSPMVIGLVSVSDQMPLHEFHDVFRTILGWDGDLGYIIQTVTLSLNLSAQDLDIKTNFRRDLLFGVERNLRQQHVNF